ncbi:MAG: hypothetical protein IKI54_00855 [Lachnospiraceae bacterium]|nr:hypothetical protein [Lachnospiraceae bacterium]
MEQEIKKIKCPNCGADHDIHLPKCPYCGFMNPEGAEEKYLNDLEKTRQELDQVDELAAENVKDEVKDSAKKLGKRLILAGMILILLGGIAYFATRMDACHRSVYELTEEEMKWQHEAFQKLDELYESGSYPEVVERLNTYSGQNHRVWDWKHYEFIYWYSNYQQIRELLQMVEEDGKCDEPFGQILVREMFEFYDFDTEKAKGSGTLDEKEAVLIVGYQKDVEEAIHERLGFSDDQLQAFLQEARDEYGYIDNKKCEQIAKEYYQQFK